MDYYQRLKDIREDQDKTQKEIAEYLQTSISAVANYENGKNMMGIDKYIKLAKLYNISLDYLTGIIETPRILDERIKINSPNEKEKKLLKIYRKNPEFKKIINKIMELYEKEQ